MPDSRLRDRAEVRYGILAGMPSTPQSTDPLRIAGFFLLLMGWLLVVSAIVLLKQGALAGFVAAGLGVEALGLFFAVRSHISRKREDI